MMMRFEITETGKAGRYNVPSSVAPPKTQMRARGPWYETVSRPPTEREFAGGWGVYASPIGEPGSSLPTSNL
jgi:hypothetical protein